MFKKPIHPSRKLFLAFLSASILGGGLLHLVRVLDGVQGAHWLDDLFTSFSAVCVTGLTVMDTATGYSFEGQLVILLLIQLGGLGVLTFSNLIFLSVGRKMLLSDRGLVSMTHGEVKGVSDKHLLLHICLYTLGFETVGAALLFPRFLQDAPWPSALWQSVFHSVSAFCNAGFSLFSDSFMQYQDEVYLNTVIMLLITAGGLGFVLFSELQNYIWLKLRRTRMRLRLSLHAQLVLRTSFFLFLGGTLLFMLLEPATLHGMEGWIERGLCASFLSVTARTAGFNTLETGHLTNVSLTLLMLLMFIGASPGSTGGGVKTTVAATVFAMISSRIRGRTDAEVLNRRLPAEAISKAWASIMLYIACAGLAVFLLQYTENAGRSHGEVRGSFLEQLFEVSSALGTVGLSTGITPTLSPFGKVVIMVCMFVGRLGPVLIADSLIGRRPRAAYSLPEENIMIG
jgi:trk system potassium uptake protein